MTNKEIRSRRKKKAIYYQVKNGEKSVAEALEEVENLFDIGKLVEADYNELADYLEEILDMEVEETVEAEQETAQLDTDDDIY